MQPSLIDQTIDQVALLLKGKQQQIKLCLAGFLAGGHLLLEDLPGMGKTSLAQALAKVLGLDYKRVQFTSDMLPADIIGSSIYDKTSGQFRFHKGPVFTELLLADEINRSTPKTQSALLEAMSESSVSVDGHTLKLAELFFVIATQNPTNQLGTFALPESQLDRFLLSIQLGYPDTQSERLLLKGEAGRHLFGQLTSQLSREQIIALRKQVQQVNVSEQVLDYIQALVAYTRNHSDLDYGISPRGALALVRASKAYALIEKREFVIPEDVKTLVPSVFIHRLRHAAHSSVDAKAVVELMLNTVAIE